MECGYFDQGHVIKDFRELAGTTPAALTRPDAGLAKCFLQHALKNRETAYFSRTLTPPRA